MSLLIDADSIVFQAGFAAERARYTLHTYGKAIEFDKKRDLDAYVKDKSLDDVMIEKERILEPLENALGNAKNMLVDVVERFPSLDYKVYLSGKDNFRDHVDSEYKANRDPTHRPHWEPEIREYMKRYWNAEQVDGMEADDAIGIRSYSEWMDRDRSSEGATIASIDKDMRMLPGTHYNWNNKTVDRIEAFEAEAAYLRQLVTGDRADNIPGIFGIGPAKVDAALWDQDGFYLDNLKALYEKEFGSKAKERFNKNRLLLWICRSEKDIPRVEDIQGIVSGKITWQRTSEPEVPWSKRKAESRTTAWYIPGSVQGLPWPAATAPVPQVPGNRNDLIVTDDLIVEQL